MPLAVPYTNLEYNEFGILTDIRSNSQRRNTPPAIEVPPELYNPKFTWIAPEISPTDQRQKGFGSHRRALAVLGADDPGPPPASGSMSRSPAHLNPSTDYFQHDPNSSLSSSPKIAPNDSPGTFFHDYSEHEASPASATFRPGTGRTYTSEPVEFDYNGDDRRPSVASATTVSSQGSKSSTGARFRKRLQGFFGDEYTGSGDFDGNSQKPAARPVRAAQRGSRERANSDGTRNLPARSHDQSFSQEEKGSDSAYPPREITPWLYQSINVSCSSFLSSARDGW